MRKAMKLPHEPSLSARQIAVHDTRAQSVCAPGNAVRKARHRKWLISALASLVGATAMALSAVVPTYAEPPRTDDVPSYDSFPAIADPGTRSPEYFQPMWYAADSEGSNSGHHIQAHGGQVLTREEDGRTVYYWYGEDRSNGYANSPGVHVYRSLDAKNWVDQGLALRSVTSREELTEKDGYFDSLYDTVADDGTVREDWVSTLFRYLNVQPEKDGKQRLAAIFERPKVLYNAKNDNYVMWWHADGKTKPGGANYSRSMAAVAVSESPQGPFKMQGAYRLYNRENYNDCIQAAVPGQSRDMTVFQDKDGTAYLVYSSEENRSLYIAKLNEDYTNVEKTTDHDMSGVSLTDDYGSGQLQYSADGKYPYIFADGTEGAPVRGEDFQIVRECGMLEAPALFEHDGRYYVVTSGATGWAPNQQTYYTSRSLLGDRETDPWIRGVLPDDPYEDVAYNSIPEGGDGYMSIGDHRRSTFGSQSTHVFALNPDQSQFIYMGDRWNAGAANSPYVWLPIIFGEDGALQMHNPADQDVKWSQGWDESYWNENGGPKTAGAQWHVELPQVLEQKVYTGASVVEQLPTHVDVTENGITRSVGVTWKDARYSDPGQRMVRGTLDETSDFHAGRVFTRLINVEARGLFNIAPQAEVTVSSREDLAHTINDGILSKGWDDWRGGGQHPRDSWIELKWNEPRDVKNLRVITYQDGNRATWPSTIDVSYLDSVTGEMKDSAIVLKAEQDPEMEAPVLEADLSSLPPTSLFHLRLRSEIQVWQSISEIQVDGYQPSDLTKNVTILSAGKDIAPNEPEDAKAFLSRYYTVVPQGSHPKITVNGDSQIHVQIEGDKLGSTVARIAVSQQDQEGNDLYKSFYYVILRAGPKEPDNSQSGADAGQSDAGQSDADSAQSGHDSTQSGDRPGNEGVSHDGDKEATYRLGGHTIARTGSNGAVMLGAFSCLLMAGVYLRTRQRR